MGWGERHGDGEFPFRARWNLPPGSKTKTKTAPGFATQEEAKKFADAREEELRVDLRRGDYHDQSRGEVSLDDYFWKKWLPAQRLSEKSVANRQGEYRNHLAPVFGARPLNGLDPFEIQAFENRLRAGVSQSTAGNVLGLLRMMLEDAVLAQMLRSMPMLPNRGRRGTRTPSDAREGMVATVSAIEAIAARLTVPDRTLVRVAAFTGMRWGEVSGLRRSFLTLQPAVPGLPASGCYVIDDRVGAVHEHPTTGRRTFGPPKGGARGRTVALAPVVVEWLLAYLKLIPKDRDLLFANQRGDPHQRNKFSDRWRPACDGWPALEATQGRRFRPGAPPVHPGLVPHDLRHTLKTLLADSGIEKRLRDDYLGHHSEGMDGVYIHPTEAMRALVPAAIQARWEEHVIAASPNVLPFRAPNAA